jgi:hypothetical protein
MCTFVSLGYVAGQIFTQLSERRFAEQRSDDYLNCWKSGPASVKQPGQVPRELEERRADRNSVLSRGKPNCGLRQTVGRSLPPGARLPLLR